jgi:23S rRNA (uridine2552-2'-O)-methyltransferase
MSLPPAKTKNKTPHNSWTQRQTRDPFVKQAKKDGYIARSAYKLMEIDDRFHLLKGGQILLDLGAAPGGWCQVLVERTKPIGSGGAVVALDLLEVLELPGVTALRGDINDPKMIEELMALLNNRRVDGVLSDIAPNTSGHPAHDHLKIMSLLDEALQLACNCLKTDGFFLAKLFQGGQEVAFKDQLKQFFREVQFLKPSASRKESREIYLLARGFVG